jgi:hypothetical protein
LLSVIGAVERKALARPASFFAPAPVADTCNQPSIPLAFCRRSSGRQTRRKISGALFQLPESDQLVDISEAAKLHGMPVSTFWEKHKELGLLPVISPSEFRSKYRWSANEIYRFIATKKKERDTKQEKRQKCYEE